MRKTLNALTLGLFAALLAGAPAACSSSTGLHAADPPPSYGGSGGSAGTGGAAASDGPTGNGGSPRTDAPVPVGGVGGRAGTGGSPGWGGLLGTGGPSGPGGTQGTGGLPGTGGTQGTAGLSATGGTTRTGGASGTGGSGGGVAGSPGSGGRQASGGAAGIAASGGSSTAGGAVGGTSATGGSVVTGGAPGMGGTTGVCMAAVPSSGDTSHCASGTGSLGSSTWTLWSSGSAGACLTTYGGVTSFSATWNNSGDVLARVGLQWDGTRTYDQLGTISADFAETHSGTSGSFSYIGVYGMSVSPCVEYYIIEDSFDTMPVNLGSANAKGTAQIDGGTYALYAHTVSGTAGSQCSGAAGWMQFYSVRKTARQCGTVSISEHFAAWAKQGMTLGKLSEATLAVEAGGGNGRIDFGTATVTAQ